MIKRFIKLLFVSLIIFSVAGCASTKRLPEDIGAQDRYFYGYNQSMESESVTVKTYESMIIATDGFGEDKAEAETVIKKRYISDEDYNISFDIKENSGGEETVTKGFAESGTVYMDVNGQKFKQDMDYSAAVSQLTGFFFTPETEVIEKQEAVKNENNGYDIQINIDVNKFVENAGKYNDFCKRYDITGEKAAIRNIEFRAQTDDKDRLVYDELTFEADINSDIFGQNGTITINVRNEYSDFGATQVETDENIDEYADIS